MIDQNRLYVGPHFPLNLALIAELLGWDHVVPGDSILEVQVVSSGTAPEAVTIRYRHSTGDEETLHLVVQDRDAFLAALTKIRGH